MNRDDLSHLPTREPPAPVSGNAFIYILACPDSAIYVGSAGDVAKRLTEHGGPKGAKFTRGHRGGRLIYVEGPFSIALALQRERQLKRWSRAIAENQRTPTKTVKPKKLNESLFVQYPYDAQLDLAKHARNCLIAVKAELYRLYF
jgi:putative endonuclease